LKIGKLIYSDIPKFFYALRYLRNKKTIHSRGIKFDLIIDNFITKFRARTFNEKEPDTLNWIDENLNENDCFFDIGANIGVYSLYSYKKIKNILILAFEPEYSNLDQLKKNIILNSANDAIIPYSIALSNKTELSYLNVQNPIPGSALHIESKKILTNIATERKVIFKEGVSCYKLDDFVSITGFQPSLIKIDVDGNEMKILEGATNTLMNKKLRSILLEIDKKSDYNKIKKYLEDANFKYISKFNENQIWSKSR